MPNRRIEQYYYRNGQIRMENREVGGELHGLCHTWHYNGQLAERCVREGKCTASAGDGTNKVVCSVPSP